MKLILNVLKKWLPAALVMGFIYSLSSVTGPEINNAGLGNDNIHIIGHFFMYLILCFAFFRATGNIVSSILLTIIFGFTDEYHQNFIYARSASLKDIVVDSAGALTAGLLLWKYYPKAPRILKNLLSA